MKKFILLVLVCGALIVSLEGCGGGNGGGGDGGTVTLTATPTAAGTTVNMTAFKNVFYGKTAGAQYSFTLTGSDSTGKSWTGSYTIAAKGATTLTKGAETQNVTQSQALITLQQAGGTPTSTISNSYFKSSDESVFIFQVGSNQYVASSPSAPIPDNSKVGDFGTLALLNQLFGGAINTSWQLAPGVNGASQLVVTSDISGTGTGTDTGIDTFTLDANGVPTKVTIRVINRYLSTILLDLTLSGNRN